jgi:hypothetical protein
MTSETKLRSSRHINRSKPDYQSTTRPHLFQRGWYEPDEIETLPQLFDGLWLLLRRQVFRWDVEGSREQLAN